jgi:hypothetical protein
MLNTKITKWKFIYLIKTAKMEYLTKTESDCPLIALLV